jgi:acetyltransferase-like isoleucine patch superfamily enzyme
MSSARINSLREELTNLDLRFSLCTSLVRWLPPLVGNRLRTKVFRLAGLDIGSNTTIGGNLLVHGAGRPAARIRIGSSCWLNDSCVLDGSASITIGDHVDMGQAVMILTNTHVLGGPAARAGAVTAAPVVIEDGVWIGARATVLPGVTIGAGCVVAAGAVVNKSVAPHSLVAGVPARLVRRFEDAPM